jgi:hypothetical protein
MNDKRKIFEQYYAIYSDVIEKIEHKKYQYTDLGGFSYIFIDGLSKDDIRESQKIYWQEILQRVHFASVISLIRSHKWLEGVVLGVDTKNLLLFSSSFRGFLEATVDSHYSLGSLPTAMALNFKTINSALKGQLNQLCIQGELENKLIHFQFAKKGSKRNEPEVEIAFNNADYIKWFDLENIGVKDLYSDLCEIAHPAAASVKCFTKEEIVSEKYSYAMTSTETDNIVISELIDKYSNQIEVLLKMGLSLYCICLKILTLFNYQDVNSNYIDESVFVKILNKKSWDMFLEMMEKGELYLDEHNMEKIYH